MWVPIKIERLVYNGNAWPNNLISRVIALLRRNIEHLDLLFAVLCAYNNGIQVQKTSCYVTWNYQRRDMDQIWSLLSTHAANRMILYF